MPLYDVNAVIDRATLRGLPLLVILATTSILVLDGLDIQIISLVAPLLRREFGVTPASLGPVLAAALLGMALGGFLLGGLGDSYGRRPTLLVSVALFAVATLSGATIHRLQALILWRFLTGIGLGGAIPNAMALLAEFTGPRWRTQAVAAAVIGVPVGGMAGAAIGAYVLPVMGWRTMFIIGGVLPLIALCIVYVLLPESPRFLATQSKRRQELVAVLNRLGPQTYSTTDQFELRHEPAAVDRAHLWMLLARPYALETCALWIIFLTNMFTIFTFFSWNPVILGSFDLPLSVAVRGSLVFNLAGVCGGALTAWLISRAGSRWPSVVLAIIGILTLHQISQTLSRAAISHSPIEVWRLMASISVVGFVMIGIQTAAYRLSTYLYPTQLRASGVGWAAGFGRLGGILSSLIAGWILATAQGAGLFATLAGVVIATLLGLVLIRRHLPGLQSGAVS